MSIAFENSNKPVTWGELVNLLAEMHKCPNVDKAKKDGNCNDVAEAIRKLDPCPGRF